MHDINTYGTSTQLVMLNSSLHMFVVQLNGDC